MDHTNHITRREVLLRLKLVRERTGLPRSTIYFYMSQGLFPKPIRIGLRNVAWTESSIEKWIQDKIAASKVDGQVA